MARQGGKDRGLFERPNRSGIWWIRYIDSIGHEHRERVGAKGLARRLYEKRKTEIREARYFPPEHRRVILVREMLDNYQRWAETSGRTIADSGLAYKRLYDSFGSKPADGLLPDEIETFKLSLAQTLSPASVNRHLQLLRAAYNRALRAEKLARNPFRHVKLFQENNERDRYLTEEEETRLKNVLSDENWNLVEVAMHTGLRREKQFNLRWADIDFHSCTITVLRSKNGERRYVPMNDRVKEIFQNLPSRLKSEWVFPSETGKTPINPNNFVNRVFNPALEDERARITDFHWHDLRHTFASRLVMKGVDLYTVQILLGHKTPEMVQRYAHLSPGHLRQAVEKLTVQLPEQSVGYGPQIGAGLGAG